MAKFVYKMQNILTIKSKMEEQAKMEYAACRMKLNEEEEKLEQLESRKAAYEEEACRLRLSILNVLQINENKDALLHMEHLVSMQKLQIHLAEEALEKARQKLQEFMMERKTHERLKEKAFEVFIKEENSKENKVIDELTSYTYGKKSREEI